MKSKLKHRNEFGEDEVQYEISTSGDKNNNLTSKLNEEEETFIKIQDPKEMKNMTTPSELKEPKVE